MALGKRDGQDALVQGDPENWLTGGSVFSRWMPLWGFLGIGLPITFAGQIRPASMYLRSHELVYLYATEFLMLGVFGLIAVGLCFAVELAVAKAPITISQQRISRVGFAIVLAIALFFGAMAWITTFKHSSPSLRPWILLLSFMVTAAALTAAFGWLKDEIDSIAELARTLSLVGMLSLLALPLSFNLGLETSRPFAGVAAAAVPPEVVGQTTAPSKPNIVLITIDTLAASHLTPYGSIRPTSPNITELASKAIVYDQFRANSNFTTAGIASIMTGVLPWTHRVLQLQSRIPEFLLPSSLPARLKSAGYKTAYFGSNPWAGGRFEGFAPYFDHKDSDLDWVFGPCFDQLADIAPYLCPAASNRLISYSYSAVEHVVASVGLIHLQPHSDLLAMVDRVTQWCKSARSSKDPVFLWVHFFPPHDPYAAPAPWLGKFDASTAATDAVTSHPAVHFEAQFQTSARLEILKTRYDESVAYVDHYVGQVLESVRADFGPNTVIILTADHGESFAHGYGSHGGVMLYEDLVHIPLIISMPGAGAGRHTDLASQIDLAPTIASAAGLPPSPSWIGRSLLEPPVVDATTFSMNFEENRTVDPLRTGSVAAVHSNWKFVEFFGNPTYPSRPILKNQLFDISKDPDEYTDVSSTHPDIAAAMSSLIGQKLARYGGAIGG